MKSSNVVWLRLEVLEDRMALNGAFGGALQAGAPSPIPLNGLTVQTTNNGQPQAGLRNSPAGVNSQSLNPVSAFQGQLQSFQAAQTAMVDQFFSDVQSLLQQLNLQTVLFI